MQQVRAQPPEQVIALTATLASFLSREENAQSAERELLVIWDLLAVKYVLMVHTQKLVKVVNCVQLITFPLTVLNVGSVRLENFLRMDQQIAKNVH